MVFSSQVADCRPTNKPSIHNSIMRLFAVVASLVVAASAQQLLVYSDTALPACAQQCTVLQNAQTGCIPPAAPVTDATIYESCFCQSGYLTTLKAAGSTICSDVCEASDVSKIASWFRHTDGLDHCARCLYNCFDSIYGYSRKLKQLPRLKLVSESRRAPRLVSHSVAIQMTSTNAASGGRTIGSGSSCSSSSLSAWES
jgi:hypothetical protein